MLDSISKYMCAEIPDGIPISGNILPAREAAGNVTRQLVGEDLCFLAEAASRLRIFGGSMWATTPLRYPDAGIVNFITGGIHTTGIQGRTWEKPIEIDGTARQFGWYVKDVNANGTSAVNRIDACLTSSTKSVQTSWAAQEVSAGTQLQADTLRRLFYDLRRNVCQYIPGIATGSGTVTHTGRHEDEDHRPITEYYTYPSSVSGLLYSAYVTSDGYSKDVNAWAMNEVNFEAGDYVLKPGRMVPKLFFDVTIEHFKGMHHTYRDMVVAQAGINQSGKITPVSLNSTTVLAAALSARGLPDSIDDMEDFESINVQFNSLGMVFQDMDIYTGDIDWNWEPPASA